MPSVCTSKKAIFALVGVAVIVFRELGLNLPQETVYPIMAYIVGQGVADVGKEKVKLQLENGLNVADGGERPA